ncbi:MAG TPA: flagellar hook-associated protein FlgL [Solirubrobacteraceae bacterium]|nr:flagellar hook-associated protein FlgL [Solirubrobacteraceae bacterium]
MSAGRITEGMLGRRLLTDLRASTQRIATAQRHIASGRRLERPSDDPLGTHNALRLRSELAGIAQDRRTISDTRGWLETTDSALATMTDVVHRARELALQGANGTLGQAERNKIADEIDQLVEMAKSAANTSYGGRYVFAGQETDTAPYAAGAGDAYSGDSAAIARQIGPGVAVRVNVTGDQVLGSGGGDGKLLSTLRTLAADLRSGNLTGVRGPALTTLQSNLEDVTSARGVIGAMTTRLESAEARLSQVQQSTVSLLSETEDTDIAKAMIELTTQQNVYHAALKSGQALVQPSLLDFLR